eukprot:1161222-Pelagomonas_calceolata.AAC.6
MRKATRGSRSVCVRCTVSVQGAEAVVIYGDDAWRGGSGHPWRCCLGVHMNSLGVEAVAIHGDKEQEERERSIDAFKSGEKDVLVATDVASKQLLADQARLARAQVSKKGQPAKQNPLGRPPARLEWRGRQGTLLVVSGASNLRLFNLLCVVALLISECVVAGLEPAWCVWGELAAVEMGDTGGR